MAEAQQVTRYDEMLQHAEEHRAADMLVKGIYAGGNRSAFKGCSVGCFLHSIKPSATVSEIDLIDNKHLTVSGHYGYPEWLARLQDCVFEGLSDEASADWHVQLAKTLKSAPVGMDWQIVLHRVHIGILRISYRTAGSAAEAVKAVLDLHERALTGAVSGDEWSAAWSAESAARSAAESAAWSAESAESAAWSAAWSAAFEEIRDVILNALSPDAEKLAA